MSIKGHAASYKLSIAVILSLLNTTRIIWIIPIGGAGQSVNMDELKVDKLFDVSGLSVVITGGATGEQNLSTAIPVDSISNSN